MFKTLVSTKDMPYDDWLVHRKKGIGGSDASIVCGINKYKSTVQLWMEKTDQLKQDEAGEAAYWGTLLESFVKSEFTKRTGIEVLEKKELLQSTEHPFMLANLDGICQHPELGTCIFEAKTASAYKIGEWEDSIPAEYLLQIQHYMAVTGYKGTYIAVLIGGNTFKWKFIERDEELIAMIIKLESDFWKHVEYMTPPDVDGSDACAKFLSEKYPDGISKSVVELPDTANEIIEQYKSACEQLETLKEQKQKAENQLKEMLGDNETGTLENNVVSWKNVSRESFDSKTLKSEHPKLYEKFASKISYRRFSVKEV